MRSSAVTSVSEVRVDYGALTQRNLANRSRRRNLRLVESGETVVLMTKKKQLEVNPGMCWKCRKYQGFEICIVIGLWKNNDNNMIVLEIVV